MLANENQQQFDALPDDVWIRWLPAIAQQQHYNETVEFRFLLATAIKRVPEAATSEILKAIERENHKDDTLWILYKLVRVTWPRTDNLNDPSYAEAYLLVANAQIVLFIIDQVKIEYLRNMVYQYQVWLLFAMVVAAAQIAMRQRRGEPEPA